uniref:Protein kinase domain-containing protein n=1 Tax=Macrostomum lignano TaxID=282301 RepID=A0A1I8IMA4_9PLAT
GSATDSEAIFEDKSSRCLQPPALLPKQHPPTIAQKLEEQIQAGVSFELESPRGIKFLSLYALRELTMRKNELKALENSLTKQITAMRTEVQSVLRFLEPVGADIPTDNSEPSFWPINSWEKYVQFASSPNEHISTLKSLLRSCKRDKWSDALMAMLNESLSKEMQAVINLIGSDMRSRAVAAGVATNLTDAQLGFQSTLLSHFQKAITFIYGATAEAGRPSEQSVRNTCRQQLKHGGDRLKGRSHRTGSQLLSGVQTQSPASDSAVQRQSLVAATPSPASGSAVQRQSLVAATQSPASGSAVQRQSLVAATPSPASGSAVQRQSLVAATPSPASGSAVQRQSLVAATPSPLLAAPYKDSLWWQRLQAPLLAAPYKDSLWWQRLKVPLLAAPYKDSLWWQRLQAPLLAAPFSSDSSPASGLVHERAPSLWWQRLKVPLLAALCKDDLWWQRLKVPLLAAPCKDGLWWQRLKVPLLAAPHHRDYQREKCRQRRQQSRAPNPESERVFSWILSLESGTTIAPVQQSQKPTTALTALSNLMTKPNQVDQTGPKISESWMMDNLKSSNYESTYFTRSPLALLRHHIADVVPRVPVEALFEPALVQVVPDEAHASAQHKHAVEGADLNEFFAALAHLVDELHRDEARVHSVAELLRGAVQSAAESVTDGQQAGVTPVTRPESHSLTCDDEAHLDKLASILRQAPLKPQQRDRTPPMPKSRLMISVIGTPAYSSSWPRSSQIDVMNELGFLIRPTVVHGHRRGRRLLLRHNDAAADQIFVDAPNCLAQLIEAGGHVSARGGQSGILGRGRLLAGVGAGASVTELNLH